jgi:hypothetical protein
MVWRAKASLWKKKILDFVVNFWGSTSHPKIIPIVSGRLSQRVACHHKHTHRLQKRVSGELRGMLPGQGLPRQSIYLCCYLNLATVRKTNLENSQTCRRPSSKTFLVYFHWILCRVQCSPSFDSPVKEALLSIFPS